MTDRVRRISDDMVDPYADPAIPYFVAASFLRENNAKVLLREPLSIYDTNIIPASLLTDPTGPLIDDVDEFDFFRVPLGDTNKTLIETNMQKGGENPANEIWVIDEIQLQIVMSHHINVWMHEEFRRALAQGVLTFYVNQRPVINLQSNIAFVHEQPVLNYISRLTGDDIYSWPDCNNPQNSRMVGTGSRIGYQFNSAPICLRPKSIFFIKHNVDRSSLEHLLDWLGRLDWPPAQVHFLCDHTRIRIHLLGRKYTPLQKP